MFFKIGFLKNFAIFTGKHLYWSLFFIKLYKKETPVQHRSFLVNIAKFLRIPFDGRFPTTNQLRSIFTTTTTVLCQKILSVLSNSTFVMQT